MTAQQAPQKPKALRQGARIAPIAPASPANADRISAGKRELERLGFTVGPQLAMNAQGYFTGSPEERRAEFLAALNDPSIDALIATRGGFGSAYLLDVGLPNHLPGVKPLIGFSDITTLQIYLWQRHGWPTFYGPMLAAALDHGWGVVNGCDLDSFQRALVLGAGYAIDCRGEPINIGSADGILLGGAMTLVEATLGTPWELDTAGAILVLEDRAMKPYQVDRVLLHLKHAGKFKNVRGVIFGDFPECDPPFPESPSVRDVVRRILGPLNIPILFGAPIGHTSRPLLTLPLGVPVRLAAEGQGTLEVLEPTVTL